METKQHATKQPKNHRRNKRENKKINIDANDNKYTTLQNLRCSKISSKWQAYSNTSLPQETRKKLK